MGTEETDQEHDGYVLYSLPEGYSTLLFNTVTESTTVGIHVLNDKENTTLCGRVTTRPADNGSDRREVQAVSTVTGMARTARVFDAASSPHSLGVDVFCSKCHQAIRADAEQYKLRYPKRDDEMLEQSTG